VVLATNQLCGVSPQIPVCGETPQNHFVVFLHKTSLWFFTTKPVGGVSPQSLWCFTTKPLCGVSPQKQFVVFRHKTTLWCFTTKPVYGGSPQNQFVVFNHKLGGAAHKNALWCLAA
jgi:hypothetical protein